MSVPVLEFSKVSKRFILRYDRPRSFQELLLNLPRRRAMAKEELWALKDVSFQVARGEMLGILGPNGAGKSTLLKLVARILKPTSGRITANGRVSALLELGAGFHPDLTGRENIYLQGSILGLSRKEVRSRFDDIVAFSELERFIDLPLKHYSTGMYMRLGFALAVHVEPEILLIDESLAVGDEAFQARCFRKIDQLRDEGITIILVSHNSATVQRFCERAILLDEGEIIVDSDPGTVSRVYQARWKEKSEARLEAAEEEKHVAIEVAEKEMVAPLESPFPPEGFRGRWGYGEITLHDVRFFNAEGKETNVFQAGEGVTMRMRYRACRKIAKPIFGLEIHGLDGTLYHGVGTKLCGVQIESVEGEGMVSYTIDALALAPGTYLVSVSAYDLERSLPHPHDHHVKAYQIEVVGPGVRPRGLVYLAGRWLQEPIPSGQP